MGEVIRPNARTEEIEKDVRTARERGEARGGEIASTATARLSQAVASIDEAIEIRDGAAKAASAAWAGVLAADDGADIQIGSTRDDMWTAVGRVRQSADLDRVYPGGIGTYTSGDPRGQPLLMEVLVSRIRAATAPQWSAEKKSQWANEIEAARVPYAAAVERHRPLDAVEMVAQAGYKAAVRAGLARLVSFKRDLKNLGLTETQIHEIIPDRETGRGAASGGAGSGSVGGTAVVVALAIALTGAPAAIFAFANLLA